jgi:hypothetical protein
MIKVSSSACWPGLAVGYIGLTGSLMVSAASRRMSGFQCGSVPITLRDISD